MCSTAPACDSVLYRYGAVRMRGRSAVEWSGVGWRGVEAEAGMRQERPGPGRARGSASAVSHVTRPAARPPPRGPHPAPCPPPLKHCQPPPANRQLPSGPGSDAPGLCLVARHLRAALQGQGERCGCSSVHPCARAHAGVMARIDTAACACMCAHACKHNSMQPACTQRGPRAVTEVGVCVWRLAKLTRAVKNWLGRLRTADRKPLNPKGEGPTAVACRGGRWPS